MPPATDIQTIRKFIQDELKMREYVFRRQPDKQHRKIAECDAALAALDRLEAALVPEHPKLFSEEEL